MVCTDHSSEVFFECQKHAGGMFKEVVEKGLIEIIDKCTIQMYEKFSKISIFNLNIFIDMKEI
jgi:hypothetical protein